MGGLYYICGLSVNHWCDKSFLIKDYYYLFIKPYFTHHIFLACPLQPLSKGSLLPFPRSLSRLVFLSLHIPPSPLPYFTKKWAASNLQNYIAYSHYQGKSAKILTSTFTCDVIRQWSCLPPAREFWIFYAAQLILSRETFAVKRKVAIYNFSRNTFALQSVLILTSSKIKSVMIVSSRKLKLYPTVQRQTLQNQCFGLATTDEIIAHKQGKR